MRTPATSGRHGAHSPPTSRTDIAAKRTKNQGLDKGEREVEARNGNQTVHVNRTHAEHREFSPTEGKTKSWGRQSS